jgi:hypothetical protein
MAKQRAVKAKVELHPKYKVPRRFYDIDEEPSIGNTRQIAEDFLKKVAGDLQISPDLSGLKFDQIKESMLGKHVLFQQQHSGRPITGAWVRVDIDPSGKVFNLQSDLLPNKVLAKAEASAAGTVTSITADQAKAKALAVTGSRAPLRIPFTALRKSRIPSMGSLPQPGRWSSLAPSHQASGRSTWTPFPVRSWALSAC